MTEGKPGLLVVDDDELILELLIEELRDDYDVIGARTRAEVKQALRQLGRPPSCALVDLGLPPHTNSPREGLALVRELVAAEPECAVIVVSGQDEEEHGKVARTLGAAEYVSKPCDATQIRSALDRAGATRVASAAAHGLMGESAAIARLQRQVRQFADAPYPVLIEGESGTGKELVARALHRESGRTGKFVALNCAAVPEQLFEATLFGSRRGSYTGATADSVGLVGASDGGTLFLDEIGDMHVDLQPKLLRTLETGEYYRVGDSKPSVADIRVTAATNRPLLGAAGHGRFREDLYHRLSVLTIRTPSLRETGDDRILLLGHFRDASAEKSGTKPFELDKDATGLWLDYPFPGNVRELRNVVARLQVKHPGTVVSKGDLGDELLLKPSSGTLEDLLASDARKHAKNALAQHGDHAVAASKLGIEEDRLLDLLGGETPPPN